MNQNQYTSTQLNLLSSDKRQVLGYIYDIINNNDVIKIELEPHCTVKYGLHDQLPTKLSNLLLDVKPITIILGKTSIFETEEYDVVKMDVISGELKILNKLISDNLEVTDTYPIYVPHLTLFYAVRGTGNKYAGDNPLEGKMITFDRLTFSPFEGEDTEIYFSPLNINK